MDGFVGLSHGAADNFSDLACSVRVFTNDRFEVHNGSAYSAASVFSYTPGRTYAVEMVVDLAAKTYSVIIDHWIIAENYSFRSSQSGIAQIDNLVIKHQSGSYILQSLDRGGLEPKPVYETVYSFYDARESELEGGAYEPDGLVQASDGFIYGVAGDPDYDTSIFRMKTTGEFEILVTSETSDWTVEPSSLVEGGDGLIYGTRFFGRAIFRLSKAGKMTIIRDFSESENSVVSLFKGIDGQLRYVDSTGQAYRLAPSGSDIPFAMMPSQYDSGAIQAPDGSFYIAYPSGGTHDCGCIRKVTPAGTVTTLLNFTGEGPTNRGNSPSNLIYGADGNIYGLTTSGGLFQGGTLFKMTLQGSLVTLTDFDPATLGAPKSLLQEPGGSFLGTADYTDTGHGSLFRATAAGQVEVIHEFSDERPEEGELPRSLIMGADGNYYGACLEGGANRAGTIFRITPSGSFSVVRSFSYFGTSELGARPRWDLIQTNDGSFWGTTEEGGRYNMGVVFRMSKEGEMQTVFEFPGTTGVNQGERPWGGLVQASDGNLYGTTSVGGLLGAGTIFRVAPGDGSVTTLVNFTMQAPPYEGYLAQGELVEGDNGFLYGVTSAGGEEGFGTIYRMSLNGEFSTLVEFTGDTGAFKGYFPRASLVRGTDGDFYGTTYRGGIHGGGTIFKMTPGGALTTLAEFTGGNSSPRGSLPAAELHEIGNGSFLGTTREGGYDGKGTLFKVSSTGVVDTLLDFSHIQGHGPVTGLTRGPDGFYYGVVGGVSIYRVSQEGNVSAIDKFQSFPGSPCSTLIQGQDGNLYGTYDENDGGGIYRLLFPGAPLLFERGTGSGGSGNQRLLQVSVNPRGESTTTLLEIGTTPDLLDQSFTVSSGLRGFVSILVGKTLENLVAGKTYYYRFRAINGSGVSTTPVSSFSTLAPPTLILQDPSDVLATSARLHATVNAGNAPTTVVFEYGTDGITYPWLRVATGSPVTGDQASEVEADLNNLLPGGTYHVRVRATNSEGAVLDGTRTFVTLTPPLATLAEITALSTTRARFTGTINANGASVNEIRFEWGKSGVDKDGSGNPLFPNSVGSSPGTIAAGSPAGAISVVGNSPPGGLVQGTTYHCRLRAIGPGGTGYSSVELFTLSILSGLDVLFPLPLDAPSGRLTVNLIPAGTGGWRFAGEQRWRLSGESATGLATGDRVVEFRPVPGYIQPPNEVVPVFSGEDPAVIEGEYFTLAGTPSGVGSLQVMLEPAPVRDGANPARWRLLGDGDDQWLPSGGTRSGLVPGSYLIECEDFPNRVTPIPANIQITVDSTRSITLIYPERPSSTGQGQAVVDYAVATGDETLPFAYVGQLRSPVGSSSGFAVKRRVVATAAHVVWDDATKSAVTDLEWLFQRHAGVHEPLLQTPRGFFIGSGYAAARQEPGVVPGEGSVISQHWDYAALYFLNDAARGGFSGFLASEGEENEFLTSDSPKILAGYPTDIVDPGDRGKLHATPFTEPVPSFALQQVSGEINEGQPFGTYFTTALSARAGCSGGPLFVKYQETYYPAAIYLGGNDQTIVRAIDREVAHLFDLAETRGYGGGNSTDGGRTLSVSSLASSTSRGTLKVILLPEGLDGAGWRLLPNTTLKTSGAERGRLRPGEYVVSLSQVDGYLPPDNQTVAIMAGTLNTLTYTYQPILTPLEQWRLVHFGSAANSGAGADYADPDGDGHSNIDEYAAGTSPQAPGDFLKVLSAQHSASGFTVVVRGRKDRSYILERRSTLQSGAWDSMDIKGPLPAENPALQLADPAPLPDRAFYRIRVQGQP